MIPQDVFRQLIKINPSEGMDFMDDLVLVFYKPTYEGIQYDNVLIDLEEGVVKFFDDEDNVVKSLAIKATLEPITK